MAKHLQRFGHRERDYDRPNRKWLCGHSVDGRECPLGPDARGGCRGSGECLPLRKGDRWFCTRPESRGGECSAGPGPDGKCGCVLTPCQPVRSLREWRRITVLAAILVTTGFLVAVIGGKPRDGTFDPGPVTSAHASENLDCRSCHEEPSFPGLSAVFDPHFYQERAIANSERCLSCHGEEIGEWMNSARFAHGWDEETLSRHIAAAEPEEPPAITDTEFAILLASKGPLRGEGTTGQLACATCHQEHHGPDHSLSEMSNQQCQVCHQAPFHSFSDGHPSFAETAYPYSRRTRIFFDHDSHYRKHFSEDPDDSIPGYDPADPLGSGTSCRHCHQADERGEVMRLRGYETSCAQCHDDSVRGGDPLTLLAVPEIGQEVAGGRWPASGYPLIPAMQFFLGEENSTAIRALDAVGESGSVSLVESSRHDIALGVASDLRTLAFDAWRNGNDSLTGRIAVNGFLEDAETAGLFNGLSIDTVRAFLFPGIRWELGELTFPSLDLETLNTRLGASRQRSIGAWPKGAAAPLTPLMLHLLSHRPELDEDLEILRTLNGEAGELRLDDLSKADERTLLAVEKTAWEIRELFASLRRSGAPFLEQFESLRGGVLDLQDTDSVLDRVFLGAQNDEAFLRQFEPELDRHRQGEYPAAVESGAETPGPSKPSPAKGQDDDFGADADDDFGAGEKPATPGADDDFGAADDAFGDSKKPETPKKEDDDFEAADDDFGAKEAMPKKEEPKGDDDDFGDPPAAGNDAANDSKPETFRVFEPSPFDWQTTGGWFHETHAIHYASTGHADPVIKAWIELSLRSLGSSEARVRDDARRLLDHTLGFRDGVLTEASGKCFKCHTVDRAAGSNSYRVNWLGAFATPAREADSSSLTHFSHAKHIAALDCVRCHTMRDSGSYADFFPARGSSGDFLDPLQYAPNFRPIDKQAGCANCHRASRSGDSCLQCHSYHSRKK